MCKSSKWWCNMNTLETQLLLPTDGLFECLCNRRNLERGFAAVRRNRGKPGVDQVTIEAFNSRLQEEISQLSSDLRNWRYRPMPVRRVEIPKPGKNSGVRLLGIPCVRDRVVQATLKELLEPIFDPKFSNSSFGFRPGRNQRQAVEQARDIAISGRRWVVDVDLSKFFDRINHDRLLHRLSQEVQDKQILRIIGLTLRSGIFHKGEVLPSHEGSVQGSPLSPLLSNIVLDELDKELERRKLNFCRYADDVQCFVGSKRAAERVMRSLTKFIERKLKLVVNRDKSRVAPSYEVKFLGMTVIKNSVVISKTSIRRSHQKLRELIPRGTSEPIERTVQRLNRWYRGWVNYYKMTQHPSQLTGVEAHIRRRLRARIVAQQKRPRHLYRKLVRRGVTTKQARGTAYSNKKTWATSVTKGMHIAYPNAWFKKELGLLIASEWNFEHWKKRGVGVMLG